MRLIIAILIAGSLTSCVTEKKRLKICATCPIQEKVIVKDTTIYLHDSITKFLPNPCDEMCDSAGNLKSSFYKVVTKDRWRTVIKTVHDTLQIQTYIDSSEVKIQTKEIVKIKQVERKKSKLEQFQGYLFWLLVGSLILYVIKKLR